MEFFESGIISLYLSELSIVCCYKNELQEVCLYQHPELGMVLVINSEIQHISSWQCYYHENLVHLAATFIPSVKRVLILGGGDLYAAFEVLKYPSLQELVICEWDEDIIELMKTHYSHAKSVCNNPKVRIEFQDAKTYIFQELVAFDLIINDCLNLVEAFPSVDIFNHLKSLLSADGVCSDLVYRHIFEKSCLSNTLKQLTKQDFKAFSLVTVPEYPGVLHLLTLWGNNRNLCQSLKEPINSFQKTENTESKIFTLYSPFHLPFYLYLPPYLVDLIDNVL